jgi:hypothetical protein
MYKDFSFLIYVKPEDEPEAFVRLLKRLAQRARSLSGTISFADRSTVEFSSSNFVNILASHVSSLDLIESIDVYVLTRYRSRQKLDLLVRWYVSRAKELGLRYIYGPFEINFGRRGCPSPNQLKENRPFNRVALPELQGQEVPDLIALFFDLCGVFYRSETVIRHACANVSGSWKLSDQTALLYHRDVREFAYDLVRSLIFMDQGFRPLDLFGYEGDLLQFDEKNLPLTVRHRLIPSTRQESKSRFLTYHTQNPYILVARHYRTRLTPEVLERVVKLPIERIRTVIIEVCQEEDDLVCYDFGEGRMIICFDLEVDF